jgi:ribosomal protein L19E
VVAGDVVDLQGHAVGSGERRTERYLKIQATWPWIDEITALRQPSTPMKDQG